MAKTAMKLKQQRKPKFSTQAYTRCNICGRPHSVLRKYGICRLCFRDLAYKGQIPGVKKASWQDVSESKRQQNEHLFLNVRTLRKQKRCNRGGCIADGFLNGYERT